MWLEKTLLLCFLAGVVYILVLAGSFTPVLDNRVLVGPFIMPPCGFKISTGVPCIACYMTRSFALMARGRILEAASLQPMGAVLFSLLALSVPALLFALFRKKSMWPLVESWPWMRILQALILLTLASWAYTIAMELAGRNP